MTDAESQHGLLLRHFTEWARIKQVDVDVDLLGELLHLRSSYDELEPTYWLLDSVEHLLLERWPSKGAVEPPDPQVLVETMDAYFRFLRSTGRMSARSADPKALTKATRQAVRRMPEAAASIEKWSSTKVLLDFGRGIGLDLDDVPDIESANARLQQIQDAWNALPVDERRRRMPHPGDAAPDDPTLNGCDQAMERFGVDDPTVALIMTFADRLPTGELPGADVVAPIFESAAYVQQMFALSRWVGDGKQVTKTGVLRPALAREAYAELGLGAWQRELVGRTYPDERLPGVAAVGREAWIDKEVSRPWTTAADCEELHRLWVGACASGLIRVGVSRATAGQSTSDDAEHLVEIGVRAAVGLFNLMMDSPMRVAPVVYALLASYVTGSSPVDKGEINAFYRDWSTSSQHRQWLSEHGDDDRWFDTEPFVEAALCTANDVGLYVETADTVTLTGAGDVFVTAWLTYMEKR